MDIFEQHFTMLKKNKEVFEKYKVKENTGIKITDQEKKDYQKMGKDLMTIEKSEQLLEVRSIHYYNVVMKKLKDYSFPEWIVCLNEKVLLEYAIPVFSRVLKEYPMLCGLNCEWQILYEITTVDQEFWEKHIEWKKYFQKIVEEIDLEYAREKLMVPVPKEYSQQFETFKKI